MSEDFALGSIQVALSPQARFEEYLRSRKMRQTEQRKSLLKCVFTHHDHFDADQLIAKLPSKGEAGHVSRPTVYRTLNEFVDAGLLRRFSLDGRAVYEHDYGYPQHDHLYCTKCRQLIEFRSDELLELRQTVAQRHHFRVTSHRLIIHGVCESCSKSRRPRRHQDRI